MHVEPRCREAPPTLDTLLLRAARLLVFLLSFATASNPHCYGQCAPAWSDGFDLAEVYGVIHSTTTFDDGTGEALFVAGHFNGASGTTAKNIVKWNGTTWSALSTGVAGSDENIYALNVYGSPAALYAGGAFTSAGGISTNGIARWNGTAWSSVGGGTNDGGIIYALAVFDDGTGPALYAGGLFSHIGTVDAANFAKWDGTSWSAVSTGTNGAIRALAVYDDGTGPALFVGGDFTVAGATSANRIAKWNGTAWSALGVGVNGSVRALIVNEDASDAGSSLYVGGVFTNAGGMLARTVARWDGTSWSPLGSGMIYSGSGNPAVTCFARFTYPGQSNSVLVAGGLFTSAGGVSALHVAKWNGTQWSALGNGMGTSINSLTLWDGGSGPAIYAQGGKLEGGSSDIYVLTHWNGGHWMTSGKGFNGLVQSVSRFDDRAGPALYVGGEFKIGGGISINDVARYDGKTWSRLPGDFSGGDNVRVYDMLVHDFGDGPALYICGDFKFIGGATFNCVAKWNGSTWSALGNGLTGPTTGITAYDMTLFDDGTGTSLYVGGTFVSAGGLPAKNIAKWNGSAWSALGSGLANAACIALTVHQLPSGSVLIAGGDFNNAGGVSVTNIAKWNGTAWSALAGGAFGGICTALESFDPGSGPLLFVGGNFTTVGGISANRIVKWNGTTWSALGSGVSSPGSCCDSYVFDMDVFDDLLGGGPALFVVGEFTAAGGLPADRAAKWNGSSWSSLGLGLQGVGGAQWAETVSAIDLGDGAGPALYVGGRFEAAEGKSSSRLAKWTALGNPVVTQNPLGLSIHAGENAVLSAGAIGAADRIYQWRKNGSDLVDGGAISGANTNTLTISPTLVEDGGNYDVVITNACGSVQTQPAVLTVTTCFGDIGPGGGDGHINCADLILLINSWGPCRSPGDCLADIAPSGGDGVVNTGDLLSIINNWGPCF